MSGLHFCLSFIQSWLPATVPFARRGKWVDGFLLKIFFFFLRDGGLVWLSFVAVCFVSFLARSILAART